MTILEPWRGNDALKFVIPGLERSGEGYDVYTMCTGKSYELSRRFSIVTWDRTNTRNENKSLVLSEVECACHTNLFHEPTTSRHH